VRQHRDKTYPNAFTARYKFYRLVYYEAHPSHEDALRREKQVKAWTRAKRVALIQSINPRWNDLSREFADLLMAR
jgi:putative endonuclease